MAIRTYKVTLDSKNAIAPEPVFLRQGDKTGAVVIDATLMDNGSPVSLSGLTPSFMANTADGKAVVSDTTGFSIVNAVGGKFTYKVPSQLGSIAGKIKIAYFSFSDSAGAQSTFNVVFVVEKAADMTQESAKDWVSNLNEIIDQYNQWVNNAHSSWQDFVNENKEIIESIDPGGTLLTEVIAARNGKSNLKTRLDDENAQVTERLVQTESKIFTESMVNHKRQRGMITILDDDGFRRFYDWLYPLALEYNIPMTSAVVTEWVLDDKIMTIEQLQEIQENGMEIINHTHTSPHLDELTEEELHYEFQTSTDYLNQWGIKDHNMIVYPFGDSNELVRDVAKEYFEAGFDIPRDGTYGQLNDYPMDMYNIRRTTIGQGFTQGLKAELDKAAAEGKWVIVMSHINQNTSQNEQNYEATMRGLIDYALGLGLEFVTCHKGLEHHGNLAQFGGTRIGANGEVESDNLLLTDHYNYSESFSTNNPITDYPKNRKTQFDVRDTEAVNFNLPYKRGGVLETYRGNENFYAYQEFTPRLNNYQKLIRRWDVSSESWRDWESVGLTRNVTENDYTPNAPISEFPLGENTKITIASSTSVDYLIKDVIGREESGIIETHRTPANGTDNYSYQMFHANTRNIVLKRRWLPDVNKWGEWFIVNSILNPKDHSVPLDSTISAYPVQQKVISKVMTVDNEMLGNTREGTPVGGYGLLETYRYLEDVYSYQIYYNRGNLKTYIRWWTGSAWSGWGEQTNSQ